MNKIEIQHDDRFSSVILKNQEADIWCEINRFEGKNRKEMADQIFTSIERALHYERTTSEPKEIEDDS